MTATKKISAQALVLTLTLGLIYSIAPARDREFHEIARGLSARFDVTRSDAVWQGAANLVIGLARPAGLRRVKLIRFEQPLINDSGLTINQLLDGALGPEWRPLLRQQSRRTGRETHLYIKSVGDAQHVLLVGVEAGSATLLQATLDPSDFAAYLEHPADLD